LEARSHEPFAQYLKSSVLDPMGLRHSSFEPDPAIITNLAKAEMWTYDGLKFEAPTFQLGMAPAGSMYSTVNDLGHFVSVLLSQGKAENRTLLKPATLEQMWSPQFPNPGGRVFGLGFQVRSLDGQPLKTKIAAETTSSPDGLIIFSGVVELDQFIRPNDA
jgi:CubicO group peptidase (beta-lactamase class C family)